MPVDDSIIQWRRFGNQVPERGPRGLQKKPVSRIRSTAFKAEESGELSDFLVWTEKREHLSKMCQI